MPLPTTGELSFSQVYNEISGVTTVPVNYTLAQLSETAETALCRIGGIPVNFSAPYAMNDFLGMDCSPLQAFTMEIEGDSFFVNHSINPSAPDPNYTILWGDGTSNTITSSTGDGVIFSKTYSTNQRHEIKVIGSSLNGFAVSLGNTSQLDNKLKVREIKEWGNYQFVSGNFTDCRNMIVTAQDIPTLSSGFSGLGSAFFACQSITSIPRLNEWDVSNITSFGLMFQGATLWNQDVSGWVVTAATNMVLFAGNTAFSTENYDLLLLSWSQQTLQTGVDFGVDDDTCYNEVAARNILTGTYGWNITDGGVCPIATPSNVSVAQSSTNQDVTVNWTDNSNNEEGFEIYSTVSSITTLVGTVGANITTFLDTSTKTVGGEYYWTVVAIRSNAPDSNTSLQSATITIQGLPALPTNVTATASGLGSNIDVTWTDNGTNNDGNNEDGFRVFRSINSGTYTQIASLGFNTTFYSDTSLKTSGNVYRYQIESFNGYGVRRSVSSNSVTVS